MKTKELVKRYVLFVVSLFFSAVGVAVTKHGELGVSPISSVANVLSEGSLPLSLGNWLIIWNCILILGQIAIMRKEFKLVQLLQIPLSFLFGWFTDLGMIMVSGIAADIYAKKLACVAVGTIILGFGISLSVIANVIMNSGEAFVKAVSDKTGGDFGNVKIIFDISCVVLSIVLSLVIFKGKIVGTREGTLLTACCTGLAVKFFLGIKPMQKFFAKVLN